MSGHIIEKLELNMKEVLELQSALYSRYLELETYKNNYIEEGNIEAVKYQNECIKTVVELNNKIGGLKLGQ